jgi:hemin uptake protein HemP
MVGEKKHDTGDADAASAIRCMDVRALLGDQRELRLEHEGQIYRLRITANGKLILTK